MRRALSGLCGTFAAALLVVGALAAGPARGAVFQPETFTLDNGLQVVVVTNRAAPVVSHMIWYRVGAADEPPRKSGLAHFLEHLMFRGTETVADGEFVRIVARNGGDSNAFTHWDFTAYFENVAVDRLALVMELEADRMHNLDLDDEAVFTERDVIIEERRQRIDNDPMSRLAEQMYSAMFVNHPYGTPIIGWEHEMAELSPDDVRAFYDDWYAPNNAIVVIAGDVDADTVRPLAEQIYGPIAARDVPERLRPQEPDGTVARRLTLRDPRVQQPNWQRFYRAPGYDDDRPTALALQVLSEVLGAATTSRLYRELVVEQGLAVGAGSGYSPGSLDPLTFGIYVTPKASSPLDEVEAAVDGVLETLIAEGIDEDELEAAKQRLVISATLARDSLDSPARVFGRFLTTGATIEDVEDWPNRISAVTAEDVAAAAEAVLDIDRSVTGILLPAEGPDRQAAEVAP